MIRDDIEHVVDVLGKELPTAIARHGLIPDSCILHTRSALFVLEALDVHAYALPVEVAAMNKVFYDLSLGDDGELHPPPDGDFTGWDEKGARILNIGGNDGRGKTSSGRSGWDGHLVTVVEDEYLVDCSLGAWDRPEKGIRLEPVVVKAREFIQEEVQTIGFHGMPEGTYVMYSHLPKVDYLRAPDWRGPQRTDPWVRETLNAIVGAPNPTAITRDIVELGSMGRLGGHFR